MAQYRVCVVASTYPRSEAEGVTRLPLFDFAIPARVYGEQGVSRMAPRGTTSKYHPRCFPPGATP